MKLKLEVEIDTNNDKDAEVIRRLIEQLEELLNTIERFTG